MFKNDIEALTSAIPSNYNPRLVLAAQIRLVLRNLPLALLGTIFTSLCFFATMFFTYDLNANQKSLNTIWLAYHTIIIGVLWLALRLILKRPDNLDLGFLKKIFISLFGLFLVAIGWGVPVFIDMLYRVPTMELSAAKILICVWIFFHAVIIYVCWMFWKRIKALAKQINSDHKDLKSVDNHAALDKRIHPLLNSHNSSFFSLTYDVPQSSTENDAHHLAHYAVYSILFICSLAIACLWALAIGKAFTTNINNSTQVIVLLGLHLGLLSGGISSLAMFWRVYIAYAVPSIFMWGFLFLYMDEPGLKILAFAVVGLLLFDIFFARHTATNTLKAILIFLENNHLLAQLRIKTKQVEEASLAKTQFLAAASHDLRQPLHALSLFIEALSESDLDSHQKQIVDYAKSASQSSREMLNTILDFAHLESGQMTPHFTPTNLDHIISHLVDEFGIQAQNKGLSLRYKPNEVWVMTDPTMVALILRNLISNAIRYTHTGGILVGVKMLPSKNHSLLIDYCQVSVWDTGCGMKSEEIDLVFDSFYQIERNKTTEQGLGLGLSIVKGMSQLLRADLKVKSNLGVGSQFSIVLPVCEEIPLNINCSHAATDYLIGKTVLIVDDDDTVLKSMQVLLESWGCRTVTVQTLSEAIEAFRSHQPDIVITDLRLTNGETGEDVILAISDSTDLSKPPPFVILTANTSPQLLSGTKTVKPTILHKPIDPKTFRESLQRIAAKR